MNPTMFDIDWFLSTAYGKAWLGLDAIVYENAYIIASTDQRMIDVENNCPDVHPTALSMYISMILTQGGSDTAPVVDPSATDKVAYVTSDKVYDTQRSYTLVDAPKEVSGALPSNILTRIFEQCRSITTGMRLVRARVGCDTCSTGGRDRFAVGDMSDG
jgi:hypothetical protein